MNEPDQSNGYEEVAEQYLSSRSKVIGAAQVRRWSHSLPQGSAVLDLGCGSGVPIGQMLAAEGFSVYGIDASPRMIAAFRQRVPSARVTCAAAEASDFFSTIFDGIVAWGLLFLLKEDLQQLLIARVAGALRSGGRFLFTAPRDPVRWRDSLTGRESVSLGAAAYRQLLLANNLVPLHEESDEGDNHYYSAQMLKTESISSRSSSSCYDEDSRSVPRWPFVPYPAYWPKSLKKRGGK